jgi:predicted permease
VEGRDFTEHDNEAAPGVAIVNEALARRQWPGESALGKRIHFGMGRNDAAQPLTVVAVVKNARQDEWIATPGDEIYVSYYQRSNARGLSYLTFVARTRTAPEALVDAARDAVGRTARGLPVSEVQTMERVIADQLWRPRLATLLLGAFAGVALLLAAVGIYGVISYAVGARTQEIGIRMALGASAGDVRRMAFREGMGPALAGAAAGLCGALGLARFMKTLLYGVTSTDPYTFAVAVAVLLAAAGLANVIPAIRATRVDPMRALRE